MKTDEETPVWTKEGYHHDWSCKLCAKLEVKDSITSITNALIFGQHMKRM